MENLFIAVACIALILMATVSYASSALSSADLITNSFKDSAERSREIFRSDITATGATTADGSNIELTLVNTGNTSLRNYGRWDVIFRYQDGTTLWLPYSAVDRPGWINEGTYYNGVADLYRPGILDPQETLKIQVRLSSAVAENTTSVAVVSTDTGVSTQIMFTR